MRLDKFSSGLNVARGAKFSPVPNICFFSPLYCIVLPFFWRFCGLRQSRNVWGTDFDLEGFEILTKIMQNGNKKQIFGTVLNLALVLH